MSVPQSGGGPIEHRHQLVEYLEAGCKPKAQWRIGTEHEKFGYIVDGYRPLPYDGPVSVRAMLDGLTRFGWERVEEDGKLIGLKHADGASISLEPGGQFELSGALLDNLHQTCDEVHTHLAQVRAVASEIGAGFLGAGTSPKWSRAETPIMPKGRYGIMRAYMPKKGSLGLDMMLRTCTIQVNLDFSSEADMVRKLRLGFALQPIATALFANSPFLDGKPTGFLSTRAHIWTDTDPDRSGTLPFVFEEGFGFERWADYALDVPMYFLYRDGRYIDVTGHSFRDFLDGKVEALKGETPTLSDWADHLTTIFPEARLKKFIEMRGADGGPWARICALPAFWVGLLYEQGPLDAAWDIAKDWTAAEVDALRMMVMKRGLAATIRGRTVRDIARDLLALSDEGLRRRARADISPDETGFLKALHEIVDRGTTPAEELLKAYHGRWQGNIDRIFEEQSY
jgi:glutamate--cysteine ligase